MSEESSSKIWPGLVKTLIAAILTAAVGYAFGFLNERRKAELSFVNDQIEKLYGPLYALSTANDASWQHFREHNWPRPDGRFFFNADAPPTADQVKVWRTWMREVFQPQNRQISDLIVKNSQLIIGGTMPGEFSRMISHTAAYDATIANWRDEQDAAACRQSPTCSYLTARSNTAMKNAPTKFSNCVRQDYLNLKALQQQLRSQMILVSAPDLKPSSACN